MKKQIREILKVAKTVVGAEIKPQIITGEKDVEKADFHIKRLQDGLTNKKIYNVHYTDAKFILGSVLDRNEHALHFPALQRKQDEPWEGSKMQMFDNATGNKTFYGMQSVPIILKVMKDNPAIQTELDSYRAFLESWMPVFNLLKEVKPFIVKGRVPSDTPNPNAPYRPPEASGDVKEKVLKVLAELIEPHRAQLEKNVYNWLWTSAENFIKNRKPTESVYDHFKGTRILSIMSAMIKKSADQYEHSMQWNGPAELKPNAKEICAKQAKQMADDTIQFFMQKNTKKLASIVEAKETKAAMSETKVLFGTLSGLTFDGEIKFVFSDNTMFTVRNKVVSKYSYAGTYFQQFPTTFHNVHFADGKKAAMVPEEQMNEEWAKA